MGGFRGKGAQIGLPRNESESKSEFKSEEEDGTSHVVGDERSCTRDERQVHSQSSEWTFLS